MAKRTHDAPDGGLPVQSELHTGRAVFTEAYAVIPAGVMRDTVTSRLPFWEATRAWILARPLSGFAETFAQYLMEVAPGGGSARPEPEPGAEAALFVLQGALDLSLAGTPHRLSPGGFAYIPPGSDWRVSNAGEAPARFHWIRKAYDAVPTLNRPRGEGALGPDRALLDRDGLRCVSTRLEAVYGRLGVPADVVALASHARAPLSMSLLQPGRRRA